MNARHGATVLLLIGTLLGIAAWRSGRLQLLGAAINGSVKVTGAGQMTLSHGPGQQPGDVGGPLNPAPIPKGGVPGKGGIAPQSTPPNGLLGLLDPGGLLDPTPVPAPRHGIGGP